MSKSRNIYRKRGTGCISKDGYLLTNETGRQRPAHIAIVERALGHPLPAKAVVHHWNDDKADNEPANLLVCPDQAYHMLIHQRMRAFEACGNADWRRCVICKVHGDPDSMSFGGKSYRHYRCINEYNAALRRRA